MQRWRRFLPCSSWNAVFVFNILRACFAVQANQQRPLSYQCDLGGAFCRVPRGMLFSFSIPSAWVAVQANRMSSIPPCTPIQSLSKAIIRDYSGTKRLSEPLRCTTYRDDPKAFETMMCPLDSSNPIALSIKRCGLSRCSAIAALSRRS